MKKLYVLFALLVGVTLLTGCTSNKEQDQNLEPDMTQDESLAVLGYLSSGFLSLSSTQPVASTTFFLANEDTLEIETELEEVNEYMDRLKVFIENGTEGFGNVQTEESDNPDYLNKLSFTVNEEVYAIYFNVDEVTLEHTGIIVINEVVYDLEVQNVESETSVDDESDDEAEEDDEDEEEENTEESETKMVLIARNGDDMVKVVYKTETEEDESTTKFELEETIAGVTREVKMKISREEENFKIDIEEDGNEYTFKMSTEDDETMYRLKYEVDGVKGEVRIKEVVAEDGSISYEYRIKEGNKTKNVNKGRPEKEFDEDDEVEDEEEDAQEA